MDHDGIEALRDRHPAWRLLRAGNAPLVLSFLGHHFVEENNGATPVSPLSSVLDDVLYSLNADLEQLRYPRSPVAYLDEWAEAGWLRRFYPPGSDEVHYDALPAFERAYAWVAGLRVRPFVGTESRLHTIVALLRQIVHGTEGDPEARLATLQRRRDEVDHEIAGVQAGDIPLLDPTALRDRYQQLADTARGLLSDFREVEENFRALDRTARERIASWEGSKGDLLADLVGGRADISSSDQGRSFQAFYDFLLSETRQDELSALLAKVNELGELSTDRRLRTIHYDWSEAAERTQRTVRQISEQLRRFLDDQVWLENRRVLDLIRQIEAALLRCRERPPLDLQLEFDEAGIGIALPFERPLYDARPPTRVDSLLDPLADDDVDVTALFGQTFVDQGRLADNVRSVLPPRSSALLTDILDLFPLQHGIAEVVGYLALGDEDIEIIVDEEEETVVNVNEGDVTRRVRMPKVTVGRR
jgi:flagellar motility protein MotE (MotC chaperone)